MKRLTPRQIVRRAFWAGFLMHTFIAIAIQDWYGLERYIERLNTNWIHLHWAVWIIPIFLTLVWYGRQLLRSQPPFPGTKSDAILDKIT